MSQMLAVDEVSASEWIKAIPSKYYVTIREMLDANNEDEAKVAELWLSRTGPDANVGFGAGQYSENFINRVQDELRKLLCGDAAYENERKQAAAIWGGGKTTVISTVASAVAIKVGIAVAVLVPVIGLLLAAASKVTLTAWCAMSNTATAPSPSAAPQ